MQIKIELFKKCNDKIMMFYAQIGDMQLSLNNSP